MTTTPASAGPVPDPSALPPAPEPDDPQQLELRLFERIDAFRGVPPDRALWRELVDLAIGTARNFTAYGKSLSAGFIHHLTWAIYGRSDRAGVAHVTDRQLAADMRREPKAVTAGILVVRRLGIIRTIRASRRAARFHALNLGGLDWPAVRRRAVAHHREHQQQRLDLADGYQLQLLASGVHTTPLNSSSGVHTTPPKGVRTEGQVSESIAAASTSRASTADHRRQEQQQPGRTNRIEGLIGAIAARSRALSRPFDEDQTRQDLTSGERTVDDLQRQADELDADCTGRPFADPASGRRIQRNPEAIAASVEHQRRLAADEGRPFDEAAARLEAERADDLHLAECLALADRRQERAGEDGD